MVDFNTLREHIEERKQTFKKILLERFGTNNPNMPSICKRCKERMGDHYTPGFELFCPDEWVAAGHKLAD